MSLNIILFFQMLSEGDVEQITERLHSYTYNCATGPLWCVKVLPVDSSKCLSIPSISFDRNYHCYNLLFGCHHSIGDTTSLMKVYGTLVSLIEDVMDGVRVDDDTQVGVFDVHEEFGKLMERYRRQTEASSERENVSNKDTTEIRKTSVLTDVIQVSETTEKKTRSLTQSWDPLTTCKFISKCKEEGVTVNSGFVALANVSLVDILANRELIQDSYDFHNVLVVNLRRYWVNESSKQYLGACISATSPHITTNLEFNKDQFWDFVHSVNQIIHESLKPETFLYTLAQRKTFERQNDITINNMGDVTDVIERGKRKNVRVTFFTRSTSIHNTNNIWDLSCHTFNGCFINTLLYNTGFIPDQVAEEYMSNISKHLKDMIGE